MVRGQPARSGRAVGVGAAEVMRLVLLCLTTSKIGACARKRAWTRRERAKRGRGQPQSCGERHATICGMSGACRASGGGTGAAPEGRTLGAAPFRPSDGQRLPKARAGRG